MSKFGFGKVFLGLTCGLTIPFCVHDNIYYAIATCFLSPHLKYSEQNGKRNPDKAIPVECLDNYLKDIGKSFLLFWIILGPTMYRTYWLKENMFDLNTMNEMGEASTKTDSYAEILKKIKHAEQSQ